MRHLSDIKPGQVIGRYEFLAPIAQGGMAAVWAARQRGSRGFSKVVAIKTMLPAISEDPRFERMFLDEAQIASRIRHGNVVEILDLGEENEILYLVMEWVDGESLSVMRRRAEALDGIPLRLAVRIVADVCAGLHAAHELADDDGCSIGLVHRDVSPQNILVGYDGNVKILDFGVAKVAGRSADTTNIGHARGKPPYMAPEQALGKAIDRRADVFSLGIIFYQLLVGRHPFRGENDIATLHNIISDQAVTLPRDIVSSIPESIETIVLRAIERTPDKRFQTAREFELALDAVLDESLGRVRSEEIGHLMAISMGPMQEDRRAAIRDAIRQADSAEPTLLDVSIGDSSPSASDADGSGPSSQSPGERTGESHARQARSVDEHGNQTRQLHSEVEEFKSAVSRRRIVTTADRWFQVLLAMAAGAALAWAASKFISKPMPREVKKTQASALVELDPHPPAQAPETERTDPPATRPAVDLGDAKDMRRIASPRRSNLNGGRAAAGGASNPLNALPPVPSPGF